MDGEKATDGGLERGSHPLFAAVIAVGEGDIMAITGIGYGRTFVYEAQKRVMKVLILLKLLNRNVAVKLKRKN